MGLLWSAHGPASVIPRHGPTDDGCKSEGGQAGGGREVTQHPDKGRESLVGKGHASLLGDCQNHRRGFGKKLLPRENSGVAGNGPEGPQNEQGS